jgi:two-component system, sensor histidine kinase and response regulator
MRTTESLPNTETSTMGQLDKGLALSRVGGDEEFLRELASLFLDDYPRVLEELKNAITARSAAHIEHHAHSLKGSVSNFGAPEVVAAALALEQQGRNQALAETPAALKVLEAALARLKPELESLLIR